MNLPPVLSKAVIDEIKPLGDSHAVRVILHEVNNSVPYRLACHHRQYVFDKCGVVGRHILDIPISLWMHGAETEPYRDNTSISEDFRTAKHCAHSIQIISLGTAPVAQPAEQKEAPDFIPVLRELMGKLGAPESVRDAFDLIRDGGSVDDLRNFVDSIIVAAVGPGIESLKVPATPRVAAPAKKLSETPAAKRMREMRERKKAKKNGTHKAARKVVTRRKAETQAK